MSLPSSAKFGTCSFFTGPRVNLGVKEECIRSGSTRWQRGIDRVLPGCRSRTCSLLLGLEGSGGADLPCLSHHLHRAAVTLHQLGQRGPRDTLNVLMSFKRSKQSCMAPKGTRHPIKPACMAPKGSRHTVKPARMN